MQSARLHKLAAHRVASKLNCMLILASTSPRRHELLRAAGIDHIVRPAHVAEVRQNGEAPEDFVQRLAQEKAHGLPLSPGDTILGADTIVCLRRGGIGKAGRHGRRGSNAEGLSREGSPRVDWNLFAPGRANLDRFCGDPRVV